MRDDERVDRECLRSCKSVWKTRRMTWVMKDCKWITILLLLLLLLLLPFILLIKASCKLTASPVSFNWCFPICNCKPRHVSEIEFVKFFVEKFFLNRSHQNCQSHADTYRVVNGSGRPTGLVGLSRVTIYINSSGSGHNFFISFFSLNQLMMVKCLY